jgi:nitroreductase/NAD-dependent dihydropyrimidine dehydrogenase PreA subunit
MMTVNKEKCIGCGLCVKDCIVRDISLVDNKATMKNKNCFKCGHCIAVCPKDAITMDDYNMDDVKEYAKETFDISPENLLNFIQFRRSVRHFKAKEVETEKLLKIIEAGRFTQTGINIQDVSYIVVQDNLEKLKELTLLSLKNIGEHMLENMTPETKMHESYARLWIKMYVDYKENPNSKDRLFFNAPAIIVVTANSPVNGALASSNMELMTNALGLGTFFSGFLARAAKDNKAIKDFLQIEDGKEVVTCLVLGYPDIKYSRTVPRKDANISWK